MNIIILAIALKSVSSSFENRFLVLLRTDLEFS